MKNEFIVTLAFVFLLFIIGMLFIKIEQPRIEEGIVYKEQPILKNKNFSLSPGSALFYAVVGNSSQNFSFLAEEGGGCVWLYAEGSAPVSCVSSDGTDGSGSNIALKDPAIFFFKPWMLALNDTFSWAVDACFIINNKSICDLRLSIKVIRVDYIGNKKFYVVKSSFADIATYQWVEDERRIAVREIGPGYEIVLVNLILPPEPRLL